MTHIIALRKRVSVDRYNRPVYEPTATRYRALVTFKPEEIRTTSGEERVAHSRITMAPVVVDDDDNLIFLTALPDINPEYELTLPDGSHPAIIAIEKHDALEDMKHIVIRT